MVHVEKGKRQHTSQDTATTTAVGDAAVGVDAELGRRKTTADAVLAVIQLADRARRTTRGRQVEAASVVPGDEGVGAAQGERCNSEGVLHNLGGMSSEQASDKRSKRAGVLRR